MDTEKELIDKAIIIGNKYSDSDKETKIRVGKLMEGIYSIKVNGMAVYKKENA